MFFADVNVNLVLMNYLMYCCGPHYDTVYCHYLYGKEMALDLQKKSSAAPSCDRTTHKGALLEEPIVLMPGGCVVVWISDFRDVCLIWFR